MDNETLDLLKTVCAAGRARDSYHGISNERLEHLVEAGLLSVSSAAVAGSHQRTPRRHYHPTQQALTMLRQLSEKGAA